MNKEQWITDRLPIFRVLYPEKTNEQVTKIITRNYDKFSDIIEEF